MLCELSSPVPHVNNTLNDCLEHHQPDFSSDVCILKNFHLIFSYNVHLYYSFWAFKLSSLAYILFYSLDCVLRFIFFPVYLRGFLIRKCLDADRVEKQKNPCKFRYLDLAPYSSNITILILCIM